MARPLHLDFQRRAWDIPAAGLVLLALGLGLGGYLLAGYPALLERLQGLELRATARADLTLKQAGQRPAPTRLAPETEAALEQALRQLAIPWPSLFLAIEASKPAAVTLQAVAPDAKTGLLRLDGRARSMDAVLGYLRDLVAAPGLSGAHLLEHEYLDEGGIRFAIQAHWREPAR